jgi:hypothetical protein
VDWRVLAARICDIRALHLKALDGILSPEAVTCDERDAMSKAARTAIAAAAAQHWQVLPGIAQAARARAARIEARVKAAKYRDWCAWLGCEPGSVPTRLARSGYRWVKGDGRVDLQPHRCRHAQFCHHG